MGIKEALHRTSFAVYSRKIRATPRQLMTSPSLLLSTLLYATAAIPVGWEQGSSSVVPLLPGFQHHFGISSGTNATAIRNFISIVYAGGGVGALLSFFMNDRIGRLWSLRLYIGVYILGQIVATTAPGLAGLYAARIISGLALGALLVTGNMSIVEIAPAEIRGLLTAWFLIIMGTGLVGGIFCVYGILGTIAESRLQYQIVFFSPAVFMAICGVASFFLCESPRWLMLADRPDDALKTLVRLRGLPATHARVQTEYTESQDAIRRERLEHGNPSGSDILGILKETFTVPANLRRVQQTMISYGLAQLSGSNAITSYFIPILTLLGTGGSTMHQIMLTGVYGLSITLFCIIASFFFVDALGRRMSLFIGITLQMIADLYVGVYVKFKQEDNASDAASRGALAFIFLSAFGFVVGLLILPYVFSGELWPNRIRSFGGAISQCFHFLFIYAMAYGVPSLLSNTDNWGAFIFFAGWCFLALIYVYFTVPEVAGLSVEEIDSLFQGSWFNAYKRSKQPMMLQSEILEEPLSQKPTGDHIETKS